jgi:3-dehydroquinate synthase
MNSWRNDIIVFDESLQKLKTYISSIFSAQKIVVICDTNSAKYCLPHINDYVTSSQPFHTIIMNAGEENKTMESALHLWNEFTKLQLSKSDLIINLGGGMICDLGGFAASIYKRGVPFIHIPTTLLAQIDASIGGKTGIDWNGIKNLIGTIHAPEKIFISSLFLETLPEREYNSGLAEALKHGLISNAAYWKQLTTSDVLNRQELIEKSIIIKTDIVEADPYEKNIRKKLNFGHTIGHALESYFIHQNNPVLHGEAVAAGMICEAYVSHKSGLIIDEELSRISLSIKRFFKSLHFPLNDIEKITENILHDKKNNGGQILMVLLHGIGNAAIDIPVSRELIKDSLKYYASL